MTKTVDISGFDAGRKRYGYEWGCQVICMRALRWLRAHAVEASIPTHLEFKNIVGLSIPSNEAARQMEAYILDYPKLREFGATGAMVQAAIAHAKMRFQHGDDWYFNEFKDEPGRTYEFDERDAFDE